MWKRGGDFRDALEYAAQYTGVGAQAVSQGVRSVNSNKTPGRDSPDLDLKAREREQKSLLENALEEERKRRQVEGLYQRSRPLEGTLGERYLRDHRGIKGSLPQDIRFTSSFYNGEKEESYPALLSFTRDKKGDLRAYQATYLDPETASKADVPIAKKTHGLLRGSYVEIQKEPGITYLAEGVETALSLREAGVRGTILASLGTHNMKNYEGRAQDPGKTLILVGDNDGKNSKPFEVVKKASFLLKEKGYMTEIIYPEKEGQDFNDLLREEGREKVFESFKETQEMGAQKETLSQETFSKRSLSRGREEERTFGAEDTHPPSDLPHSHSLSGEGNQKKKRDFQEPIQKDLKTLKEKEDLLSFESLYKEYKNNLKSLCESQVGEGYKKYLPEIRKTAERASQLTLGEGYAVHGKEREVIFARAQYEVRRGRELEEKSISLQEDFSATWMKDRLMADVRARCEGAFYQKLREEKGHLDKADLQKVRQKGKRAFEKTLHKIGAYEESYIKHGIQKEEASFIAKAQVFYEVSYQKPLESQEMDRFLQVVRSGYVRSSLYTHLYEEQVREIEKQPLSSLEERNTPNPGGEVSVSPETKDMMERISKYRVFEEIKEILPRVLGSSQDLSSKEMQKIQEKVETQFNKDHRSYDIRQAKEERVREERSLQQERDLEAQREQTRALGKERDRGFER